MKLFYFTFSKILCVICFLLIFVGCARYNPSPLTIPNGITHEKDDFEISKKILSEADCKKFFDRKFIVRGYQPVQIYIKNKTSKTYVLDSQNISLAIEPVQSVLEKLHRDIGWKATKYFIFGGPLWAGLEGLQSYDNNKKIDNDITARAINDKDFIKIKPGGIVNRVMFVANENIQTHFGIKLVTDDKKEQISFEL